MKKNFKNVHSTTSKHGNKTGKTATLITAATLFTAPLTMQAQNSGENVTGINPYNVTNTTEQTYLPKVAYRDNYLKTEYTYDNFGHVTSAKNYYFNPETEDYETTPIVTNIWEYHKMPNGHYVFSKEMMEKSYRYEHAYDSKGMTLYEKDYYYDYDIQDYYLEWGRRAVVNSSGIRTGIERYNEDTKTWEADASYTFDSKGRTVEIFEEGTWEDYDDYGKSAKHKRKSFFAKHKFMKSKLNNRAKDIYTYMMKMTYTWDANDNLTELSYREEVNGEFEEVKYQNLTLAFNGQYFNMYKLFPTNQWDDIDGYRDGLRFSWEDYTTHEIFFNADLVMSTNDFTGNGKMTTTYNSATKEITSIVTLGTTVIERDILKIMDNGSWSRVIDDDISSGAYTEEMEYDIHGIITKDYFKEEENGDMYESEQKYEHEYDAEGRITSTVCTYKNKYVMDGEPNEYEDVLFTATYDEWAIFGNLGIVMPAVKAPAIYPTVTDGIIYIENPSDDVVSLYNLSGLQLLEVRAQSIDISKYPKGIYIVKVGGKTSKVVRK